MSSALDEEAQERATSVYLVQRVIPMLPRVWVGIEGSRSCAGVGVRSSAGVGDWVEGLPGGVGWVWLFEVLQHSTSSPILGCSMCEDVASAKASREKERIGNAILMGHVSVMQTVRVCHCFFNAGVNWVRVKMEMREGAKQCYRHTHTHMHACMQLEPWHPSLLVLCRVGDGRGGPHLFPVGRQIRNLLICQAGIPNGPGAVQWK
eukprot:scaffold178627_cov23-Tisochrysis_lutea.AAC.2